MKREPAGWCIVSSSAASGFPPFYLVSIAAGTLTFPLKPFIILGFAGRFLRFTVAVFLPHVLSG